MQKLRDLVGAGGGGGGPKNDKDSLFNTDVFEMLLGLAEGPIGGLDGNTATEQLQNLFIDETPVSNGNGDPSFSESEFVIRYEPGNTLTRLQDAVAGQTPVQYLLGAAASFHNVGVALAGGTPVTRQTPAQANGTFDKIELRFNVQRLVHYSDDGAKQTSVDLEILYREVGSTTWLPFVESDPITTISGKQTVGGYNKAYSRFVAKSSTGYEFKVTLQGEGSNDDYGRDIVWAGIETSLNNFGPGETTEVDHQLVKAVPRIQALPAAPAGTTSRVALRLDVRKLTTYGQYSGPQAITADIRVRYRVAGAATWLSFISGSDTGLLTIRKEAYKPYLNNINLLFERNLPAVAGGYEFEIMLVSTPADNAQTTECEIVWVDVHSKLVADASGTAMRAEYHPGLAMIQLTAAIKDQFDRVPNISGVWKGLLCHLPTNYNPATRTYSEGTPWNGSFKTTPEWTDNPFWIAYELIVNPRIGMVRANPRVNVNRYRFYELAKDADQLLPDGKGGMKPRYTFNALITDPMEGIELINHIVGTAHAYAYEDGLGNIVLAADRNTAAVATITREMCVEASPGVCFEYTFTDITERPNEFVTSYVDPEMGWEVQFLGPLVDPEAVERYGYNRYEYQSIGCIYPQEAWRKLYFQAITAATEVSTVSFEITIYGVLFELFDIINVCDPDMDWGVSGRVRSIVGTTVNLRDAIYFEAAGTYDFSLVTNDGVATRSVTVATTGLKNQLTLDSPITDDYAPHSTFTIGKAGDPIGLPKPFRIVSISEVDGDPTRRQIVAIEVNRLKYEAADKLSLTDIPSYSWATAPANQAPSNLRVLEENRWATADGGYKTDLLLAWDYEAERTFGVIFEVHRSVNGGGYELVATTSQKGVELTGLLFGSYEFKVVAVYQTQRQASTLYWNISPVNSQMLYEGGSRTTFTVGGGWLGPDLQLEPVLRYQFSTGSSGFYQVLDLIQSGDVAGIEYRVYRPVSGGGLELIHTDVSREKNWRYPAALNQAQNNGEVRGDLVVHCLVKDFSGDYFPKALNIHSQLVPAPLVVSYTPDGIPEVVDFEIAVTSPWSLKVAAQFDEPQGATDVLWYVGNAANGSDRVFVSRGQPANLIGLKPKATYYLWAQSKGTFGTGEMYPPAGLEGISVVMPETTDVDLGVDLEKTVYVYKRAVVGPEAPSDVSGTFENPVPSGWAQTIPAGIDPVWVTSRVYRISGNHSSWQVPYPMGGETMQVQYSVDGSAWVDTFSDGLIYMRVRIGNGSWSTAIRIVGEDGADGTDGTFVDYRFRRAASQPATPTGTTPAGWFDQPPAGSDPVWFIVGKKAADGTMSGTWSTPTRLTGEQGPAGLNGGSAEVQYSVDGVNSWHETFAPATDKYMRVRVGAGAWSSAAKIVGEAGQPGTDGNYVDYRFRRAASQPAIPTGDLPVGWSDAPPVGTDPLWMVVASKNFLGAVMGSWSTPTRLTGEQGPAGLNGGSAEVQYSVDGVNSWHATFAPATDKYMRVRVGTGAWSVAAKIVGEDGAPGADGTYVDYRFQRAASQPATPTGTTPAGWSDAPPAGTSPLWMTRATKNSAGTPVGPWSTPTRLTGDQGPAGNDAPAKYTWVVFADNNNGTVPLYNNNVGDRVWQGVAHNQTSVQPGSLANSEYTRFTWYRIKANVADVFTAQQQADFNSLAQGIHPDTGQPLLDKRVAAFEGLFNELSALSANLGVVTSGTFQTAAAGSGRVRAVMSSSDVPFQIYDPAGTQLFGVSMSGGQARLWIRGDLAPNSLNDTAFLTADAVLQLRDRLGFMAASGAGGGNLSATVPVAKYWTTGETTTLPGSILSNTQPFTVKVSPKLDIASNGDGGSLTVQVRVEYRISTDNVTWGAWLNPGEQTFTVMPVYVGSYLLAYAGTLTWSIPGQVNKYFQFRYTVVNSGVAYSYIAGAQRTLEGFTAEQPQTEGILPTHNHEMAHIPGLVTALSAKADQTHYHDWSAITSKPSFATRWPTYAEVSGKPNVMLDSAGTVASMAVAWNATSGVYVSQESGHSRAIAHFRAGSGSTPSFQLMSTYRNGGLYFRSARDGFGFEEGFERIPTDNKSFKFLGDNYVDFGPNVGTGILRIGGHTRTDATLGTVHCSNGNLHIDPKDGHALYLNYYTPAGTRTYFDKASAYYLDNNGDLLGRVVRGSRLWAGYDAGQDNSISCSNWFRSSGNTGWYSQAYGGGIYMTDSTWVRTYGGKKFHCNNAERNAIDTSGGFNAWNLYAFNYAGKCAIGGSNDAWLRLNPHAEFTNGIYCGNSVVRTDGEFQVGSAGANFRAGTNFVFSSGFVRANGGTSSSWATNGLGAFTHTRANDTAAHWLITSNVTDSDIRAGIQVLNADSGLMRLYTNKRASFVQVVDGGLTLSGSQLNGVGGVNIQANGTLVLEARNSDKRPYARSHHTGNMSRVMTWDDFTPAAWPNGLGPPAGLADVITAHWIAAGAITANLIAVNQINASHIQAGSITGDRLAANTIDASKINVGTINIAQANWGSKVGIYETPDVLIDALYTRPVIRLRNLATGESGIHIDVNSAGRYGLSVISAGARAAIYAEGTNTARVTAYLRGYSTTVPVLQITNDNGPCLSAREIDTQSITFGVGGHSLLWEPVLVGGTSNSFSHSRSNIGHINGFWEYIFVLRRSVTPQYGSSYFETRTDSLCLTTEAASSATSSSRFVSAGGLVTYQNSTGSFSAPGYTIISVAKRYVPMV